MSRILLPSERISVDLNQACYRDVGILSTAVASSDSSGPTSCELKASWSRKVKAIEKAQLQKQEVDVEAA
jgi:hypothetical protein